MALAPREESPTFNACDVSMSLESDSAEEPASEAWQLKFQ